MLNYLSYARQSNIQRFGVSASRRLGVSAFRHFGISAFRVSGFRFRVSSFEFRVSGFLNLQVVPVLRHPCSVRRSQAHQSRPSRQRRSRTARQSDDQRAAVAQLLDRGTSARMNKNTVQRLFQGFKVQELGPSPLAEFQGFKFPQLQARGASAFWATSDQASHAGGFGRQAPRMSERHACRTTGPTPRVRGAPKTTCVRGKPGKAGPPGAAPKMPERPEPP